MLAPACSPRRPCTLHFASGLRSPTSRLLQRQCFHSSPRMRDEMPNHYETLAVSSDASEKEIKRSFYSLSKSHHPDLHPHDPDASKRFVRISEAYAILSSPTKRTNYDRDFFRAQQSTSTSTAYPSGSFSSASAPAGGRPASGLSRRRTQFRGPPPSFYQSGGWGEQGSKRSEYASRPSHAWEQSAASGADDSIGTGQGIPGTGPGGFTHGWENDVPHFNSRGHYQTHSTIEKMRHRARRRVETRAGFEEGSGGGNALVGFVVISGILASAYGFSKVILSTAQRPNKPGSGGGTER